MKKVARLRQPQDEFVPPHNSYEFNKTTLDSTVGVRTTGRIKKPKAVFDPSDNYVPRAQRINQNANQQQQHVTSPKSVTASLQTSTTRESQRERSLSTGSSPSLASSSSNDYDVCYVCQKREPRRGGNYRNKLLTCISCNQKLHKWCASTDFLESSPVRQTFKCEGCRTCDICDKNETKKSLDMVTCSKCVASYHLACHTPKVAKQQQTQRSWKCFKCVPNVTTTAPATKSTKSSNGEPIPVTVIRQIIGYDANMQPLAKTQNQPPATAAAVQSNKEIEVDEQVQQPSPEQINSSVKSKALSTYTNAHMTSSSSSENETTTDDEDYKYVEKKKRKITPELNNGKNDDTKQISANGSKTIKNNVNNGSNSDITMSSADNLEAEQKPIINNHNHRVGDEDLPKREVVKTWSVDKLFNYVAKFFPNEAHVFKEHEIDGNALLLLKRSDVVKKLPLKLGPSLRLFNLILKIQTQKPNDPTLGWDCSIDTLLPSTE